MSEPDTTTNLTPPIRSVVAEASSMVESHEKKYKLKPTKAKTRDRSSSSSSSTSTISSSSSSIIDSQNLHTDDDDFSSLDENNPDMAQLELRLQTLRRLSK